MQLSRPAGAACSRCAPPRCSLAGRQAPRLAQHARRARCVGAATGAQPTGGALAADDMDWAALFGMERGPSPHSAEPLSTSTAVAAVRDGRLQPALSVQERKERRAEAGRLGKAICTVQLGKRGITQNFVAGLASALKKNGLIKLKLSGSCMLGLEEALEELVEATDCVVVHTVGFTAVLYRNPALPPLPSAVEIEPREAPEAGAEAGAPAEDEEGGGEAGHGALRQVQREHRGRPDEFTRV